MTAPDQSDAGKYYGIIMSSVYDTDWPSERLPTFLRQVLFLFFLDLLFALILLSMKLMLILSTAFMKSAQIDYIA